MTDQEKIDYLTKENERLEKEVKDKDTKILNLKIKVKQLELRLLEYGE